MYSLWPKTPTQCTFFPPVGVGVRCGYGIPMERAFISWSRVAALLPPDQDLASRSLCGRSRGSRHQLSQLDGGFCCVRCLRGTARARGCKRLNVSDAHCQQDCRFGVGSRTVRQSPPQLIIRNECIAWHLSFKQPKKWHCRTAQRGKIERYRPISLQGGKIVFSIGLGTWRLRTTS